MGRMAGRIAIVFCALVILLWIISVSLHVFGFNITLGVALWGCAAYYGTLRSRGWLKVTFWVGFLAWMVFVFFTLLFSAQRHAPVTGIPVWMQVVSPYLYALTPAIVLGGLITIVPVYWKKERY